MGRTIARRVHRGGLRVEIVQFSSTQGPRFVVELGWAPGPPWRAVFNDPYEAQREADGLVQREVHDCRQRGCEGWQAVQTVSTCFAVNE